MHSERMRERIRENAKEITLLRERFQQSTNVAITPAQWLEYSTEYRARYDVLAFPGGLSSAYERLLAGDPEAMEAAVCFLEVRPYFFRSGYFYKQLMRKCRRAPLTSDQRARYEEVSARYKQFLAGRRALRGWPRARLKGERG
jgi:hypothetical protein